MAGNVSMDSAVTSPLQLQVVMRNIRKAGVENAVKMIDAPKPQLSHPLPGSNYGVGINLYA